MFMKERKHNIVYKTTNKLNGMIYIGCHVTDNLDDGYLGSGKRLKYAINKYGKQHFTREILFDFSTRGEMYAKEKELVTKEFVAEETNYNIGVGGKGGFDWQTKEYRSYLGSIGGFANREKWSKETTEKVRLDLIESGKRNPAGRNKVLSMYPKSAFYGRTHTDEWKEKHSQMMKEKQLGSKNSQFGTMWITDGTKNTKIKKNDFIPHGWYKGRVTKRVTK